MRRLLVLAAGTEVVTGLILIVTPSLATRLVFGGDMSSPGRALGPLAGFGLLALAMACWPSRESALSSGRAVRALLLFSVLCALYLVGRGVMGSEVGVLLWPAAGLHAVLAMLLARMWLGGRRPVPAG